MFEDRHLSFKAVLENIRPACEFVADAAAEFGLDDRAIYHCELAVDEVCTNIIEHGFGRASESGTTGQIEITAGMQDEAFTISIADTSPPFNPLLHESPDPAQPFEGRPVGGWGIYFMRKLMDSVDYRYVNGKNHLILRKIRENEASEDVPPPTSLQIERHELDKGYWQITLSGRLDSKTSPQLEEALKKQLEVNDPPRIVVDMAGVDYVSSSGLKVLVSSWRQARDRQGDVLLSSLQARTFEVFEMIGFDMMFNIYDSPAQAVEDDPIGA